MDHTERPNEYTSHRLSYEPLSTCVIMICVRKNECERTKMREQDIVMDDEYEILCVACDGSEEWM